MTPKWGQNLPDASPPTHPSKDVERKKKGVRGKFLRWGVRRESEHREDANNP
jgi:hypothetical protein